MELLKKLMNVIFKTSPEVLGRNQAMRLMLAKTFVAIAVLLGSCLASAQNSTLLVFDGIRHGHFLFHRGSVHIVADCAEGTIYSQDGTKQLGPAVCDIPQDIGDGFRTILNPNLCNGAGNFHHYNLNASELVITQWAPRELLGDTRKDGCRMWYTNRWTILEMTSE